MPAVLPVLSCIYVHVYISDGFYGARFLRRYRISSNRGCLRIKASSV